MQPNTESSHLFIRPRKITIDILINGQRSSQSFELNIVPTMAPVDHTFRYYEPEQSHYMVRLPPFVHLNTQLEYDLSNPECQPGMLPDSSIFTIAGQAGEAMSIQPMTLYVYADQLKSELVAVVRVEIHARPVIYTRARLNNQSMHTLTVPVGPGRTIRIFSNKPNNIFRDERQANLPIRLLPNSNNEIGVFVKFEH